MKVKINGYEVIGTPEEMATLLNFVKRNPNTLGKPKKVKKKTKKKTKLELNGQCLGIMNGGTRCRKTSMSEDEDFCFMHAPHTSYQCLTKGKYYLSEAR